MYVIRTFYDRLLKSVSWVIGVSLPKSMNWVTGVSLPKSVNWVTGVSLPKRVNWVSGLMMVGYTEGACDTGAITSCVGDMAAIGSPQSSPISMQEFRNMCE